MLVPLAAVLLPLAVISTALRFLAKLCNTARRPKTMRLAADDFFAILALVTFSAFIGSALYADKLFFEMDLATPEASVAAISHFLKAFWAASLLTPHPITAAKLSILCLYHRLFSINKSFRYAIYLTGFFCLAWWIAITVSLICTCIPISSAWKPALPGFPPRPGVCFDYRWFTVGSEIPNCILDFWIVVMPILEIRKLQLSLRIKISIAFMFLLADLVGIFSFVRMIVFVRNSSPESPAVAIWMTLQLGFAVICCNLPTYRPLLPYLTKLFPRSVTARAPSSQLISKFARTKDSSFRGAKHIILDPKRSMDDTMPGYDGGGSDNVRDGGKRKEHWPGHAIEATTTMEMV